jgi:hypothetical protein
VTVRAYDRLPERPLSPDGWGEDAPPCGACGEPLARDDEALGLCPRCRTNLDKLMEQTDDQPDDDQ